MRHELYYVTSNQGKFEEARRFFELHAPTLITLKQIKVSFEELQDLNEHTVLKHKAAQAWNLVGKPLLVDDSGFYLQQFPQFPGVLAKPVMQALGFNGLKYLTEKNDEAAVFINLGYVANPDTIMIFHAVTHGQVICKTAQDESHFLRFGFYSVFKPEGSDKTYYELRSLPEGQCFFHRNRALEQFLHWFKEQEN